MLPSLSSQSVEKEKRISQVDWRKENNELNEAAKSINKAYNDIQNEHRKFINKVIDDVNKDALKHEEALKKDLEDKRKECRKVIEDRR